MKFILTILILIVSNTCLAVDSAIYANGDGTYSYFGNVYTLETFPIDKTIIIENTVQIFPVEGMSPARSLNSVKLLARKFIRARYKVETKLFNHVVPYTVKRKGQ